VRKRAHLFHGVKLDDAVALHAHQHIRAAGAQPHAQHVQRRVAQQRCRVNIHRSGG
jgi:hypothetical protein